MRRFSSIRALPAGVLRSAIDLLSRRRVPARLGGFVAEAHRSALELILPLRCTWCGAEPDELLGGIMLCEACQQLLAGPASQRCARCGMSVSSDPKAAFCAHCGGRRLRFDRVLPLGSYVGALRECVLRLKRPGHEALAAATGALLWARQAGMLADAAADAILPVPMHWARRLLRRTNSPELVAGTLAARLQLPVWHRVLRRSRHTRKQGPMLRTQRLRNVRGAFRLRDDVDVRGKRLILVDDVLTTGATCDEVARVLRRAGAAHITVAVLARADTPR